MSERASSSEAVGNQIIAALVMHLREASRGHLRVDRRNAAVAILALPRIGPKGVGGAVSRLCASAIPLASELSRDPIVADYESPLRQAADHIAAAIEFKLKPVTPHADQLEKPLYYNRD